MQRPPCSSTPRLCALPLPQGQSFPPPKHFFFPLGAFPRPVCHQFESCPAYSLDGDEGGDALPVLEKQHGVHHPHQQPRGSCPYCRSHRPTRKGWRKGWTLTVDLRKTLYSHLLPPQTPCPVTPNLSFRSLGAVGKRAI